MKLIIEYNADGGYIFPDGKIEAWVNETVKQFKNKLRNNIEEDRKLIVANTIAIDFFRLALAEGRIEKDQIEFVFEGKTLEHNKYGVIKHWPKEYCDIPIKPMVKMMEIGAKIAKEKRKTGNA